MDPTTLALGIAGLLATTITGAAGLYFTHRARTASYRERLFSLQYDALRSALRNTMEMHSAASLLADPSSAMRTESVKRLYLATTALSDIAPEIYITLPTDAVSCYRKLNHIATAVLTAALAGRDVGDPLHAFEAEAARLAQFARHILGTDTLSKENLTLFAEAGAYKAAAGLDRTAFLRAAEALDNERRNPGARVV